MRVTPAWLEATDHCPDGLAFALSHIPQQGLELSECWPLLDRPDWVVSLAVQTQTLKLESAHYIVARVLGIHAAEMGDEFLLKMIGESINTLLSGLPKFRADIAAMAYESLAVKKDKGQADRLNCLGQLATSTLAQFKDGDNALSLKRLQGAAFSLGLSMGQMTAATFIKQRMFNLLDSKNGADLSRL